MLLKPLVGLFVFILLIVMAQDFLLFPAILSNPFQQSTRSPETLPSGVESFFVKTSDGKRIEVWHLPAHDIENKQSSVAVIFHGNGEHLEEAFGRQRWLQSLGITSYGFDYRGYGKSTGWPSEKGIYLDGDAVWSAVMAREKLSSRAMIAFGVSIGTAPAARIARDYGVGTLVLLSPYSNMRNLVSEKSLYKYLVSFLWYDFPTTHYVSTLTHTNLIIAHGALDKIIPVHHSKIVKEAYQGKGKVELLLHSKAHHNDLLNFIHPKLGNILTSLPPPPP